MIEFDQAAYHQKTDAELDRLLRQFDDLVDDAQRCLLAELKARGRGEGDIARVVEGRRKRELPLASTEGVDLALAAEVGRIWRTVRFHGSRFLGTGRAFYGTANPDSNKEYGYQEFDTTLWWTLLGVPLVPRGSYRIRSRVPVSYIIGDNFVVVRRLPFLWAQNAGWLALDGVVLLLIFFWALIVAIQKGWR